jgi:hypothetical protein
METGRIKVWGQPRQKVQKDPPSTNKNWTWWRTPVIPATQEAQTGARSLDPLSINKRTYLKNNQSKKGWGQGSSGGALASYVWGLRFNRHYHKNRKYRQGGIGKALGLSDFQINLQVS